MKQMIEGDNRVSSNIARQIIGKSLDDNNVIVYHTGRDRFPIPQDVLVSDLICSGLECIAPGMIGISRLNNVDYKFPYCRVCPFFINKLKGLADNNMVPRVILTDVLSTNILRSSTREVFMRGLEELYNSKYMNKGVNQYSNPHSN